MSLLPINPADFPDVPTKKALIAIDFQNDFLAQDGALPVNQPDGMIAHVVRLADAVRKSGYGEVVWVRSQFDTSRAVGEQQIMASDTPQLPNRPGGSAAAAAARARASRPSPTASTPLEADPEAFLSDVGGQSGKTKPQCVRKGTKGAELLPELAAAKGPRDYAMTKTYYSAFQSGQLLQLLRRHFATELYICGALSNVSVYATALAASSYGFEITIVEDCCGYRSEARHMNATRKLADLTGCEFATVADILPTLRPRPQSRSDVNHRGRVSAPMLGGPAHIPPELIAAAMAGNRLGPSKGIPVRPKSPEFSSPPDAPDSTGENGKPNDAAATLPLSSSPDLSPEMEKLRLNALKPTDTASTSTRETTAAGVVEPLAANETPKPGPAKPQTEQAIQPVVKDADARTERRILIPRANAQGRKAGSLSGETKVAVGARRHESPSDSVEQRGNSETVRNTIAGAEQAMKQFFASSKAPETAPAKSKRKPKPIKMDQSGFLPSEELLTAETPDYKGQTFYHARKDGEEANALGKASTIKGSSDSKTALEDGNVGALVTDNLCEGDTAIIHSFLSDSLAVGLFERLCSEVHFQKMMHQGGEVPRFVAVQGELFEDGTQPIYRHPSDETPLCVPFTPAVEAIRTQVEDKIGHKVNHVLIQCYRGGNDYISEHSDKTLDVVHGSFIANVSLGAERTMSFRTKRDASMEKENPAKEMKERTTPSAKPVDPETQQVVEEPSPSKRQTIRCRMPHNSLVQMGLATNSKWLHGIRPDKRPTSQKSQAELAFGGNRISLTFRHIGTFLSTSENANEPVIWGQGAVSKARDGARTVINGQTPEAVTLLKAFGKENHSSEFDWKETYGGGFDVLHMKTAARYFGCGDTMVDGRVKIMLAELGVNYAHGSIGTGKGNPSSGDAADVVQVKFVLDDADRTIITGDVAIMLYLDARHPKKKGTEAEMARVFTRFQAALALGQKWKALTFGALARDISNEEKVDIISDFASANYVQIDAWMAENLRPLCADGDGGGDEHGNLFFAGNGASQQPSIADYALWPVLQDIAETWRAADARFEQSWAQRARYTALEKYWVDFAGRKSVVEVFGRDVAWLAARPGSTPTSSKVGHQCERHSEKGSEENEEKDQLEDDEAVKQGENDEK